jgi:hypothetical protein
VKNKIKVESGDMFESVPEGGDCYILKKILHDWDDVNSLKVLKNCRKSISAAGKLLIIDYLLTEKNPTGKINDIHMMLVCPGGKERTRQEFENLTNQAGFKITKIITNGGPAVIECMPV